MNDPDDQNTEAAKEYLPFIPIWFDDANLTPFEFRVLAHLYRRRNHKTGQCNPAVEVTDENGMRSGITVTCRMNRKTVFQTLRRLEAAGLIKRDGKPFGGSNRYQLMLPSIVPPDGTIEAAQSSRGTGHQSSRRTGHQSSRQTGHQSSRQTGQEGITREGETNEGITIEGMGPTVTAGDIFNAYPRREGKPAALAAIKDALIKIPATELLAIVQSYAEATAKWPDEERKFIPQPAKWFAADRYEDDPEAWVRAPKNNHRYAVMTKEDRAKPW